MKKHLLVIMTALFLFALLPPATRATEDALAVLYDDGSLVFQDDDTPRDRKTIRQTYTVDLTASDAESLPWYDEREGIFVVDFAASVRPTSTRNWFSGFVNLEYVHNIQNLDTADDVDMSGMFAGCASLRGLDLSGFDTANVADMSGMFRDATGLLSLNLSAFDTANVTDMSGMFQRCTALSEVDLSGFSAESLESTASMFDSCPNLQKIYASDQFDATAIQSGEAMFRGCRSLIGGNGTRFDPEHTDKAYARLDADDTPGYFSMRGPAVYYTVTWKNEDDTVLQTEEITSGTTPAYGGETPTKPDCIFAGWEPQPAPVYADTTYTARFIPAVCTVTWADEDGTVLQTEEVASGTTPAYGGETPTKPDCIFAGWEPEPAPVFADTTYTARFRFVGPHLVTGENSHDGDATPSITATAMDGDALRVTVANPDGQTVVVSFFDENGRFVSADLRPAAASLTFPLVAARAACVMLLDAAYRPSCASVPVTLT